MASSHDAEGQPGSSSSKAQPNPLENDLLNDVYARNADRSHHGNLPDALVHAHRHDGRDEEKAHDETDRSEDERQLTEIAESILRLRNRAGRGERGDPGQRALDGGSRSLDVGTRRRADH